MFNIPEANQGVAVDKFFFYAINNQTIAKYTKAGKFVAKWEGPAAGPIVHLDSGVVVNGKLYAAHSNYRKFPLTSSIEVWDTQSMKHIGSHSIGVSLGSLTWLDLHDGSWYGAFANYDKTGQLPKRHEHEHAVRDRAGARKDQFDRRAFQLGLAGRRGLGVPAGPLG